jgi:hypothetical protein
MEIPLFSSQFTLGLSLQAATSSKTAGKKRKHQEPATESTKKK